MQASMAAAREEFAVYPDLQEGPPAWHKPGDARYSPKALNYMHSSVKVVHMSCINEVARQCIIRSTIKSMHAG